MRKTLAAGISIALLSTLAFAKDYATVNGQTVDDEDLKVLARSIPGAKGLDSLPAEVKKQLVEQAIERVLLIQEAKKSGIEKETEYKDLLVKLKNDLALELWMKKEFENIKVDPKEIKSFYESNKDKFAQPPKVQANHILVKTEDEAKKIIEELGKTKGDVKAKFEELAKSKSTGPSGANGGNLGWFDAKQMVKPFADAAFALNPKSYTKTPVKTQFGYHVIYVSDKKEGQNAPLEQVSGNIEQNLKMQIFQKTPKTKLWL